MKARTSMADLHQILDSAAGAFIALMVAEVLIKPVAVWFGKHLLRKADEQVRVIPDWLYDEDEKH